MLSPFFEGIEGALWRSNVLKQGLLSPFLEGIDGALLRSNDFIKRSTEQGFCPYHFYKVVMEHYRARIDGALSRSNDFIKNSTKGSLLPLL